MFIYPLNTEKMRYFDLCVINDLALPSIT